MAQNTSLFSRGAFWLGLLCIILGVVLLFSPMLQAFLGAALMILIGIILLIGGIIFFISAFQENGKALAIMILIGLLLIVIGVLLLIHPFTSLKVLAIILAIILIISGCAKIYLAFFLPKEAKTIFILSGIVSLVIAGLIWYYYPISGIVFVGIALGVELIVSGISRIILAHYEAKLSKDVSQIISNN